jgi:hypothetical protein
MSGKIRGKYKEIEIWIFFSCTLAQWSIDDGHAAWSGDLFNPYLENGLAVVVHRRGDLYSFAGGTLSSWGFPLDTEWPSMINIFLTVPASLIYSMAFLLRSRPVIPFAAGCFAGAGTRSGTLAS